MKKIKINLRRKQRNIEWYANDVINVKTFSQSMRKLWNSNRFPALVFINITHSRLCSFSYITDDNHKIISVKALMQKYTMNTMNTTDYSIKSLFHSRKKNLSTLRHWQNDQKKKYQLPSADWWWACWTSSSCHFVICFKFLI